MTDPKHLETWLHEKAGPAYDALKADPARAVTADQVRRTLDELLAEAEAAGQHPLPPEQGVWGAMEPKTNVSSESHRKGAFRSPAHPPGITL